MNDTHKLVEPLILSQDDEDNMTPTEHNFAYYDDADGKWICQGCDKVNNTPPTEDGLLHCDCGSLCHVAPKVTDYYIHGGAYADFWCPICDDFTTSVVNDAYQVECERCDIWLDLSM